MSRFLVSILLFAFSLEAFASEKPLVPVDYVNPAKYIGRWYQIARNPLPFEPINCVCTQQTLTIAGESDAGPIVGVHNSCNVATPDGRLQEIRGTATIDDLTKNSTLTVDFNVGPLGKYWIIGLDPYYRWAVVSDPDRRSLYILSKTPTLNRVLYRRALRAAKKQNSLDKLKTTSHLNCKYPAQ
jgi:apolipoprotein D and lipocalin family protein